MKHPTLAQLSNTDIIRLCEDNGLELSSDGCVYDPVEDQTFNNITEWLMFMDELETMENTPHVEKMRKHSYGDDDHYF